jgi:hypothetical protein
MSNPIPQPPPPSRERWRILLGVVVLLVLAAALLLLPLPRRWRGAWQGRLFDLAHVPLFFALTVALWAMLRRSWRGAAVVATAAAALAEVLQDFSGRQGDLGDFLRGLAGVGAAVVILHYAQGPRTARRLAGHALVLAATLAWPVLDTGPWLVDAFQAYRAFPTLADFSTGGQLRRWVCRQTRLEREPDLERSGEWVGMLTFLPGPEPYAGAMLQPVRRDWTAYRQVACAFVVDGGPLTLVFAVRTASAAMDETTHYQTARTCDPGRHVVRLDLAAIAPRADPRPLMLTNVRNFHLFVEHPTQPRSIRIERIWLE